MSAAGLVGWAFVALALATTLFGAGLTPWIGAAAAVGLFFRGPRLSAGAWLACHATVLFGAVGLVATTGYADALAFLVGWLLVHRRWTGTTKADARVCLLAAVLLVLLACLQGEALGLGAVLVLVLALLPAALLRVEAGEVRGLGIRALVAGLLVLVLATGLYFLLPRLRGGYFGQGGGLGGLGHSVRLGDDEGTSSQQLVGVAYVTGVDGRPVPGPHYLRGRTFDAFDGQVWSSTRQRAPGVEGGEPDTRVDVTLEPMVGGLLYSLPEVLRVEGVRAAAGPDGAWHHVGGMRRIEYTAWVRRGPALEPPVLPGHHGDALLALPEVDPRVRALALSVAPDEDDPRAIAAALADHLGNRYLYTPFPAPPRGDPLAWFLFEAGSGHCEYFASALAVMLRVRGVPARLATGFYTDEPGERPGEVVIRASHAHAWVEVPLASGWTRFDPSPLDGGQLAARPWWEAVLLRAQDQWTRLVVDFDLGDQFAGLDTLGRAFAVATGQPPPSLPARTGLSILMGGAVTFYVVAVVVQLLSGRLLVRPAGGPAGALGREVARARQLCRRRGWELPPGMPLLAASEWLVAQVGPPGEPLRELARLAYAARFGGSAPVDVAGARRCLAALRELPVRR